MCNNIYLAKVKDKFDMSVTYCFEPTCAADCSNIDFQLNVNLTNQYTKWENWEETTMFSLPKLDIKDQKVDCSHQTDFDSNCALFSKTLE